MAVPKRRTSHTRKRKRATLKALVPRSVVTCSNCKAPNLPHVVCAKCGYLGSERILDIKEE
ncbi:50S ribosomal protein L32 [bacterium]|nr:50S ribosomal protein L32 [bacterium]